MTTEESTALTEATLNESKNSTPETANKEASAEQETKEADQVKAAPSFTIRKLPLFCIEEDYEKTFQWPTEEEMAEIGASKDVKLASIQLWVKSDTTMWGNFLTGVKARLTNGKESLYYSTKGPQNYHTILSLKD